MRSRSDPLVPLLGVAVSIVVAGAIGLVFIPRVARWLDADRDPIVGARPSPTATVPVWVSRTADGVALMLEADPDAGSGTTLDKGLEGGPYAYLRLTVYNFARAAPYVLDLESQGFASPEGGAAARPAAALLKTDAPAHLKAVLRGMGAVARLDVKKGHTGHALLVVEGDPRRRTAFVSGELRLERRELQRRVLASWQQQPDWKGFTDF